MLRIPFKQAATNAMLDLVNMKESEKIPNFLQPGAYFVLNKKIESNLKKSETLRI